LSKATEQFIIENHIGCVPHPSYSPDLAPSDFWLFDHVKTSLVRQTFDEPEQLLEAITEFLNEIQPPESIAVFSYWDRNWWHFFKSILLPVPDHLSSTSLRAC
jgi:hypothetical protein